jgi:hypothetical protein
MLGRCAAAECNTFAHHLGTAVWYTGVVLPRHHSVSPCAACTAALRRTAAPAHVPVGAQMASSSTGCTLGSLNGAHTSVNATARLGVPHAHVAAQEVQHGTPDDAAV